MKKLRRFETVILFVLLGNMAYGQQLRLGLNPYTVEKSAVLELQSNNQGLLFPRITDTSLINALTPPDGMVIYFTPAKQLLVRSNGYWQPLTVNAALNNYWSIGGNINGVAKNIGNLDNYSLGFITNNVERMKISNTGSVGIGSSSFNATNPEKLLIDAGLTSSFNLVNAKGNINNYLQLNIQNQSNGNTASSDVVATADNGDETINYVDLGINSSGFTSSAYPILSGINNAYLYSTGNDFVIGNSTSGKNLVFFTGGFANANERMRINGIGNLGLGLTTPTALLHLKAGTTSANTAPLKFTSGSLMTTAEAGAIEFLTDKFYGTITTGNARKEFTLNDAALTSGRIPVVTTNGRLTSNANFVWDNTNSRLGVRATTPTAFLHLGAGTATASNAPLKFTSGTNLTTPETGAMEFNGTHLYFTIGATRYQLDQQTGTTYTGSNGITLVGNDFRNNLITGLVGGQTVFGGTAAGNSLTLSSTAHATKGNIIFGTSVYDELNNKLGIGNSTPSEVLDVTGNLKFSGALMPNNIAGTSGYVLSSNGAGNSPSWINFGLSNLSDAVISSPANGQVLQYNGTKWANVTPPFLSSVDTTNISGFSAKVRSLFSATSPITYSNGVVGIAQANASTDGYLSSIDWNTFNNKANSSNVWLLNGNAGTNPSTHFIGTTDNQDLVFKTNNIEWARIVSSTGDMKIGNAATGTIRSTQELVLRQDGDIYGSSILRLRNRVGENGAIFETTDPSTTLVDFIFKTATSQRNIRYEARSTSAKTGTPSFHIGGSSPDNPTLAIGDTYAAFNTNLKIGNYNTPTEALDITGNLKFSGALMPNNSAGTAGYLLQSNGSGSAPTWINPSSLPSSNWTLTGNGGINPATNFIGTTDNNSLRFRTNNAERFIIDSFGRVGIGVTDPANPLVVKDTLEIRRTGNLSQLLFTNTAGAGDFRIAGDGGDIFWQGGGARSLQMGSYWGMILSGDRQTGTFPSFLAGINGTGVLIPAQRDASVALAIQANSATQTANLTEWRNSSGTVLNVVDETGALGIGTSTFDATNPEKLLVNAGTTSSYNLMNAKGSINNYLQINIQNQSSGNTASSDIVATSNNGTESVNFIDLGINSSGYSNTGILGGANNAYLYSTGNDFVIGNTTASKNLRFFTGGSNTTNERLRIDGSGNVGIGTTSPTDKLTVAGNILPSANGTYNLGNSTYRWNTVYATNGFINTSDSRMKTNIMPLRYGLKEVMNLQPVTYNWKDTSQKQNKIGLIAQDVRRVVPEVVVGDESKETLGMDYAELVPILINAIKDLKKELDDVKKELEDTKKSIKK